MEPGIRVLVATRPRLMRQVVLSTLARQSEIQVVGEAEDEQQVVTLAEETRPDFVLIELDESRKRPALCDTLLNRFPGVRIIAVAPGANLGMHYWATLEIHSSAMETSEEALLSVMRTNVARSGGRVA